jgi:Uma2 family endonuclease
MRRPTMTYAQYLALERTSPEKHEFLRGEVWAMAWGTPSHARIATNIASALVVALKGRPCAVFNSDLRVRVEESDRSTYPDVSVVCREQRTAADDDDAIVNPTLIVEVLSDSTEASDRGEKFAHLQRLPSLMEYVLVSQREQRVELFRRGEGMWMLFTCTAGRVELKSLDVALELADVYANPLA